jgi:hypothetical protein
VGIITATQKELDALDKAIRKEPKIEDVANDYRSIVTTICIHPLLLIWRPDELIRCEEYFRHYFFMYLKNATAYEEFQRTISVPFRQRALNLLTQVEVTFSPFPTVHDRLELRLQSMNAFPTLSLSDCGYRISKLPKKPDR